MKKKTSRTIILVSVFWCVCALLMINLWPHACDTLNFKVYDWKLALAEMPNGSPLIVHVDVDDSAITKVGQWPWDRELSARIVRRLRELGAKVVAFDVLYSSPGRSEEGNQAFFEAIRDAGNVASATAVSVTPDHKFPLIVDDPAVRGDALYDRAWELMVPRNYDLWKVRSVQDKYLPLPDIIRYSKEVGHIKGAQDADGVHRRIRLLVLLEDRCIPSLTLATLAAYWGVSSQQVSVSLKNTIDINRNGQITSIPVDSQGRMLIRWGDVWDGFPHYSVTDLLTDVPDKARASRYKDKIVIVAVTATGTTDMGVTPRSVDSPLSRIHSHAMNTIMSRNFIHSVPALPWIAVIGVLVTIIFSLMAMKWRWKVGAIVGVAICVLASAVSVAGLCRFFV